MQTLTSILGAIREDERENITVVVFLADFNTHVKQKHLADITTTFKKHIATGVLQIIQAPSDYYAPLQDLHRNLGEEQLFNMTIHSNYPLRNHSRIPPLEKVHHSP